MNIDDDRLARLLAAERDALMRTASLPTARQALWRVQLQSRRARDRRAAAVVEWLMVGAIGAVALALIALTTQRLSLTSRASTVVSGAAIVVGLAMAIALAAIHLETRLSGRSSSAAHRP